MLDSSLNSSRIAKNSIFLAVRMGIVMVISIFTTRYLLANLGVEDYGVYNVTLGLVAMCSFLSPALSYANQRFHNYELGKNGVEGAKKVFNAGLLIQIVMLCIVIVLAETIGLWYVDNKLVVPENREQAVYWVYQISIFAFSLSMLEIPFTSSILAHERMDFYAIVNVSNALLKLLIAIGIAYASYDRLVIYGFLLLCVNIFNFTLYSVYSYIFFSEIRITWHVDRVLLKSMLSFSGWNLFETIARMGKDLGSNLLLNSFFGPVLNAARGVSGQVSYAFSSMVDSTVMASRPQMVASYAQCNIHASLSMFYTLSKGVLLIVFIMSLPVLLETDIILKMWLGNSIPDYTIEFVRLSIFICLIDKLASPVTALVHASGKVRKYHIISGILNIAIIPFSWIMLQWGYGPLSLYIVTLLLTILTQILFLIVIKSFIPISIKYYFEMVCRPFFIVVILTLPIPLLLRLLFNGGMLRLIMVVLSAIFCSLFFSAIYGLNRNERDIILNIARNKKE